MPIGMNTKRYVLLTCGRIVRGTYGTLTELNEAILRHWKSIGFKADYDYVDTWNEPGVVVPHSKSAPFLVWHPLEGI